MSHYSNGLNVGLPQPRLGEGCIFEPWRGPSSRTEELHDEDVRFEEDGFGARYRSTVQATIVAQFLFGPDFHHLSGVGFTFDHRY